MSFNNPPDFESVDWVALARSCGLYIRSTEPIVPSIMLIGEMEELAKYYAEELTKNPKLTLGWVGDMVDDIILQGRATTFDKAYIKLLTNRLLRNVH